MCLVAIVIIILIIALIVWMANKDKKHQGNCPNCDTVSLYTLSAASVCGTDLSKALIMGDCVAAEMGATYTPAQLMTCMTDTGSNPECVTIQAKLSPIATTCAKTAGCVKV